MAKTGEKEAWLQWKTLMSVILYQRLRPESSEIFQSILPSWK